MSQPRGCSHHSHHRDISMLSHAKAETLYLLLDGGRIEAHRTYPGSWRHLTFAKVPEGKPEKEKPVGDETVVGLAERGYIAGTFSDLGGNEHRIKYALTEKGRHALTVYENDPANADAIARRERKRERMRGAA